ncbi:MAG: VWA domain-containing protein [Planctomycetes bacterium]|nr:VWA domain-containing protein [Planctomycetota bacterium]
MFGKLVLALVAGVTAGALLARGADERGRLAITSGGDSRPGAASPEDVLARIGAPSSPASGMLLLPGMECLVDEATGIRAKVLVTERGVRCQDGVPAGGLAGAPLKHFLPYYVFDVWPREGEPEFYEVGSTPRRQSVKGWVPAVSVARWDTRVGVRYARRPDGRAPPLRIYASPDPLVEILQTGRSATRPIARATLSGERTLMPWPVAETKLVTVDGKVHELVRIDFLAELPERPAGGDDAALVLDDPAGPPETGAYTEAEMTHLLSDLKVLDIVFCVDNTRSTGPYLDAIRSAVSTIARRLDSLPTRPDLQVGLVLYRDYVDGIYFDQGRGPSVTWTSGMTSDLDGFLARVRGLTEAPYNSDEYAEAGYDGLLAAVEDTSWRGKALASRVVVLIGDNSFHEPESEKNPKHIGLERVRLSADAHDVRVFTLDIDGGGGEAEQQVHLEQFQAIADACGGACFPIDDAGDVVDRIRSISDVQVERVHANVAVTEGLRAGKAVGTIAEEENLDIRQVTEVMEFLEGADVDLSRLKPGEPTFSTGWALVSLDGVDLLEREVYLAKAESEALVGALMTIGSRYFVSNDGADRFGRNLVEIGAARRIGDPLADFFETDSAGPFDVFALSKGIPVNPHSVLRMTKSEIMFMSEADKAAIRDRVNRVCIPSLVNAQNDDGLWVFRDDFEFGWIPESYLP